MLGGMEALGAGKRLNSLPPVSPAHGPDGAGRQEPPDASERDTPLQSVTVLCCAAETRGLSLGISGPDRSEPYFFFFFFSFLSLGFCVLITCCAITAGTTRNYAELCITLPTWYVASASWYLSRCPWRIRHPAKQLEGK